MSLDIDEIINGLIAEAQSKDFTAPEKTASVAPMEEVNKSNNNDYLSLAEELEKEASSFEEEVEVLSDEDFEQARTSMMEFAKIAVLVEVAAEHHGIEKDAIYGALAKTVGKLVGKGGKAIQKAAPKSQVAHNVGKAMRGAGKSKNLRALGNKAKGYAVGAGKSLKKHVGVEAFKSNPLIAGAKTYAGYKVLSS